VRARNGKVLDCGSGLRPYIDDAVVCVEIAPYPNVDVLAVNQRLPFRTASFDGALSLNVLEHVTDPFRSAAELMRVLKPGAMLYCCIPFLQPEHGYPHHYFNATRSGLRELFAGKAQVLEHFVPRSGEPIWTLHWFLSWYAERLPAAEKKKFLDLKMADILSGPPEALLEMPWVRGLSDDGRWRLASTTAAILQKL
jgi:SAM-dependent methyltransferase